MLEQVDAWRRLWPCGEPCAGAGSWWDLWPHGERTSCRSRFVGRTCDLTGDPLWKSLFLKDCTLWKGPILGWFVKNGSLWKGLILEKFVENCLLWEGPHAGAGEECEESSAWGRRSGRDKVCTECNPCSPSPCTAWGEEVEERDEVKPRKKGGVGGSCFKM